jgi:mono/diheme cytochrome c family protein
MPTRFLVAAIVLVSAVRAVPSGGADAPDPARVQRMLKLLAGVASEYREAFDDNGVVVRPVDLEETRLLLNEVQELSAPLRASDHGLENLLTALSTLVGMRVPPDVVGAYTEVARRYVTGETGIREEVVPDERPSLVRGRALFQENCTGCHGAAGAGDGPDAAHLGITPARFSDREFMRGETPRDAFNVIMLGRQRSGMPAWGDALSPQQAWDLVGYVWSLARSPADVEAGRQLYQAHCEVCHGATGDPASSRAAILERPSRSLAALVDRAEHSDANLFEAVSAGVPNTRMPAFAGSLSDQERWALVAFVRTLSLEGAPGSSGEPMEPDHVAELGEVRRAVGAALEAHRRGDPEATALATNAYLRFEPLEKLLAESDASRIDPVEAAFVAFRTALANPATGDPDQVGHRLEDALDDAASLLSPRTGGATGRGRLALALLGGLALLSAGLAARSYARRPVNPAGPSRIP